MPDAAPVMIATLFGKRASVASLDYARIPVLAVPAGLVEGQTNASETVSATQAGLSAPSISIVTSFVMR